MTQVNFGAYAESTSIKNRFKIIFESIPDDADKILDIGCARMSIEERSKNDLHQLLIDNTNAAVTGIDIAEKPIKRMKKQGYDVYHADAQSFELDADYDVIVAGETIEYLHNINDFFECCFNHLTKNGIVIFTTENPHCYIRLKEGVKKSYSANLVYVNPKKITNLHNYINNVNVQWIPPVGEGITGLLWKLGYKRASAPKYCAIVSK